FGYGAPIIFSVSVRRPGVDKARITLRSSGSSARQYCTMLKSIGAPTLTGHSTFPVVIPALRAASQSVSTLMSSAYQYHPSWFLPRGSKGVLARMLCFAGETPLIIVVWLG